MADKITQKIGFTRARDLFAQQGDEEMVEFFNKRLEQLDKRSSVERKLTPHQIENEKIKEGILACMEKDVKYTIADMLVCFDCFPETMTPQRVSALLSQMGERGTKEIVRSENKGKAYFALAA